MLEMDKQFIIWWWIKANWKMYTELAAYIIIALLMHLFESGIRYVKLYCIVSKSKLYYHHAITASEEEMFFLWEINNVGLEGDWVFIRKQLHAVIRIRTESFIALWRVCKIAFFNYALEMVLIIKSLIKYLLIYVF